VLRSEDQVFVLCAMTTQPEQAGVDEDMTGIVDGGIGALRRCHLQEEAAELVQGAAFEVIVEDAPTAVLEQRLRVGEQPLQQSVAVPIGVLAPPAIGFPIARHLIGDPRRFSLVESGRLRVLAERKGDRRRRGVRGHHHIAVDPTFERGTVAAKLCCLLEQLALVDEEAVVFLALTVAKEIRVANCEVGEHQRLVNHLAESRVRKQPTGAIGPFGRRRIEVTQMGCRSRVRHHECEQPRNVLGVGPLPGDQVDQRHVASDVVGWAPPQHVPRGGWVESRGERGTVGVDRLAQRLPNWIDFRIALLDVDPDAPHIVAIKEEIDAVGHHAAAGEVRVGRRRLGRGWDG
jgi:hypothetical protein